ncbi:glycosyltransferase family 4 protein [Metabacillus litoralis]|uniref:glycosyltransferase family 4 protein n=1 Tax=Metabacillus litoralis TaxID=152268 RepID=UPI00203CF1A0|nr:glycosyltransferase family 4 protein [Metabacillus litoralis]MCM3652932.1 glycosyltransferase family 4 protein [Metabacillus litoralis]
MDKPKILVVGSSLKDKGGIVTVIKNIEQSSINKDYTLRRIETYITGSTLSRIKIFIISLFKILISLITFRPKIVHIHMAEKGSFYRKAIILILSKVFQRKVILHIHSASFDEFYNSNELQKKFIKFILNKADKLVVLSKQWEEYYGGIVPKEKIAVLYNGVFSIDKVITRNNPIPVGLFLGRLGQRKGTYDLLQSIKDLKSKDIKGKFYLAGDGEIEEVKKLVTEYHLDEVIEVLGWVNSEQINELLGKVDFLVLPSYNEGLPMAILESMNYGLPIISTYVGGIPEVIINEDNGYLIEPGDINGLASALASLLINQDLRKEMGDKNRVIIRNKFDIENLMSELSTIYQSLLKH